jgi:hypothetical protein
MIPTIKSLRSKQCIVRGDGWMDGCEDDVDVKVVVDDEERRRRPRW